MRSKFWLFFPGLFFAGSMLVGLERAALALTDSNATSMQAGYMVAVSFAPGIPEKVVLSGGASASTASTVTGKCLRITCTVTAAFRVGTGALSAVTDDNAILATSPPETICLNSAQTKVAFFSASAGACLVAVQGL
jgi:hypothetical protein